ncbi:MAG: hypothetical protein Q4A60_09185 [Pasteurellaceae bacterium]|nr:hypothetical protein [Pasteurellaceae bacterium]
MLKEKGYDEFLAERIRQGQQDIAEGRVISLEDAKKQWQKTIERKAAELAEFEREVAYVG